MLILIWPQHEISNSYQPQRTLLHCAKDFKSSLLTKQSSWSETLLSRSVDHDDNDDDGKWKVKVRFTALMAKINMEINIIRKQFSSHKDESIRNGIIHR